MYRMVIDLVGLRLGASDDLTLDSSDGDSDEVLSGDGAGVVSMES